MMMLMPRKKAIPLTVWLYNITRMWELWVPLECMHKIEESTTLRAYPTHHENPEGTTMNFLLDLSSSSQQAYNTCFSLQTNSNLPLSCQKGGSLPCDTICKDCRRNLQWTGPSCNCEYAREFEHTTKFYPAGV